MLEWMGLNFYYYDGLQPKIRAGIINEHECMLERKKSLNSEFIAIIAGFLFEEMSQ